MLSNPKLWKNSNLVYIFSLIQKELKKKKKVFLWGTPFKTKFEIKTASPQKYLGASELTSIALVKFMRVPFLHSATPLEDGE